MEPVESLPPDSFGRPAEGRWTLAALLLALAVGGAIAYGMLAGAPERTAGALVAGVAIVLATAQPVLGLAWFIAFNLLRPEEVFPHLAGLRLTLLAGAAALFGWFLSVTLRRRRVLRSPGLLLMAGFAAWGMLATTLKANEPTLSEALLMLLKLAALYGLALQVFDTEARARQIVAWLLLFSVGLALLAQWGAAAGWWTYALETGEGFRAAAVGNFGDPNDLALILVMAVPLALSTLLDGRDFLARIGGALALAVLLVTIQTTHSRGGELALGTALVAYFARRWGRRGLLLGGAALLVGLLLLRPERLLALDLARDPSTQGRIDAWIAAFWMVRQDPLFGVGVLQFLEHHWQTAHNSYLLTLAETGIPGSLLWLGIFLYAATATQQARAALRDHPRARTLLPPLNAIEAAIVGFAVGGFFLSRAYLAALYLYLAVWTALAHAALAAAGAKPPPLDGRFARRLIYATGSLLLAVTMAVEMLR